MGTIKDRNGKDLTEAEDIKKRWQEYTEELHTKKDLNNPDNHDGVITHLEPDILECEIKWVLGSITMNKASGSDGIPASNASLTIQNQKNLALSSCGCLIPSEKLQENERWVSTHNFSDFHHVLK